MNNMNNIVDKYAVEGAVENEDGVVAIEYVITAAALAISLTALWSAFGGTLTTKLNTIVTNL